MPSPNLLQQLHDLDRSSPEFPNQLTDILLGEVWVRCLQGLPREGFRPFVKYLDTVRPRIAPTYSPLNTITGPQQPRSYQLCFLSLSV